MMLLLASVTLLQTNGEVSFSSWLEYLIVEYFCFQVNNLENSDFVHDFE